MGSQQILVTKNWSSSDPDLKLIIKDPDPANNFGSERIWIHNTDLPTGFSFFTTVRKVTVRYLMLVISNIKMLPPFAGICPGNPHVTGPPRRYNNFKKVEQEKSLELKIFTAPKMPTG